MLTAEAAEDPWQLSSAVTTGPVAEAWIRTVISERSVPLCGGAGVAPVSGAENWGSELLGVLGWAEELGVLVEGR